ncbi:MAG: hypothetical protein CMJ78_19840 [Planctomycetaceae bacterium]|nr:hypothetical protein [Planctomycetaceae bacterium]
MRSQFFENRKVWLAAGILIGIAAANYWPHEEAMAISTDRSQKFAMVTVPAANDTEAVFILDFLTGRLTGAVLDRQGTQFVAYYYRNLSEDFLSDPNLTPTYSIVSGASAIRGRNGFQFAPSCLYISELSSGKVACYAIPYRNFTRVQQSPLALQPVASFSFREAAQSE